MLFSDVSVVIPSFNRLEMLREAVESVLEQTLPPRQLIVVDDGSTDGTWDWLSSQKGLIPLKQERRGPAAARNLGAQIAETAYLAFLDSDDLWLPQKIEFQIEFMEENSDHSFCQTEEIWLRDGVRVNPMKKHAKPSGQVFEACLARCLISPSAVMFRRDFFEELGGFDESFEVCEDYELWLRASLASPFQTLEQALIVKRGGHADQLSHANWGMDRFRVRALEKTLASASLSPAQSEALKAELQAKLKILSEGFAKRYPAEHNPYQERLQCL